MTSCTDINRTRRSVLYVPASNPRAIDKARRVACDSIILDLEDSVAPAAKTAARTSAIEALQCGGFGHRELIVRVNAISTPWGPDDLQAVCQASCHAVLVPKINDASDLQQYALATQHAPASLELWAMIETAASILRLDAIAGCTRNTRLGCLVMGSNDLAKELRVKLDAQRTGLTTHLSLAVTAARANKLAILDGVYNDIEDADGFSAQCRQGAEFGFDGKTLIHPNQIAACNRAFSPTPDEIAWSRKVCAEFAKPENANQGAIRMDGAMVERLHLETAQRVLAIAAAIDN